MTELRETTATKERIERELSIAHEIQMGMIPKIFPPYHNRKDIDLHAVLQPAKEVGGDLYDFFIEDERLHFVIGDVSGKGVPASLFMAITCSLFRTLSQQFSSPAEIMTQMNRSISENNESSMFVTLFIGILDLKTGHLSSCNAGHNPPITISPDGKPSFLNNKIQVFVGVLEDMQYIDGETTLEKGSKLFLYTDRVTEAENSQKELYGEQRLQELLTQVGTSDIHTIVDSVIDGVAAHVQEEEQQIFLKANATEQQLIFLLTDSGLSFDPTQTSEVDLSISAEERQIGGLGIFLIRSIMNEVSYQRLDGKNRLIMKKNL